MKFGIPNIYDLIEEYEASNRNMVNFCQISQIENCCNIGVMFTVVKPFF